MVTRESLLDVTARLYAEHGWRGTTTRRIAEAAGVNEVTIFRQFGSKASLLLEAIAKSAGSRRGPELPAVPGRLCDELTKWGLAHHRAIREKSGVIRACLADWGERPELAPQACEGGAVAFADVRRYLTVARTRGLIGHEGSVEAAAVMLINTIFMDAITRDTLPAAHPHSSEQSITLFVDVLLRGLGTPEGA
jgi:AcrR family transcriptional regulator